MEFYLSTNKIIIFGNREMAELANFYWTNDTNLKPVAFCVNGKFIKEEKFCGLPVVPFETIEKELPPKEYLFHAPIYASKMNSIKDEICNAIESKGYEFASYISSKAYTWNSKIGKNAFILEGCNIQPFCSIGKNVVIWSFSHVGHHSKIGNNVFISGNVVIAGKNKIEDYCFMGTNCCTRYEINISSRTFIGQSASVTKNLFPSGGVWVGVPAKRIKNVEEVTV
jgi:sugar O-acyltransferase (sialic acid O-acetyltransferase NeuD family)